MKLHKGWNYSPYLPFNIKTGLPEILSVKPFTDKVQFEWKSKEMRCVLFYGIRGQKKESFQIDKSPATFHAETGVDYEFYITDGTNKSATRLVRTGDYGGQVITYLHPEDNAYYYSGRYVASPSIVRTQTGRLLVSIDIFAHGYSQNLTQIFKSDDNGDTWEYLTDLMPCFWGSLFVIKNRVYMISCSKEYGDLLIGYSEDDGENWVEPTVLARGGSFENADGFHKSPCRVLFDKGHVYVPIEYGRWIKSSGNFNSFIFMAPENADLTDKNVWRVTELLQAIDRDNPNSVTEEHAVIEGALFKGKDGKIKNLLRCWHNEARMFEYSENDQTLKVIGKSNFPFGHVKFQIIEHDEIYYAFGNTPPERNKFSLAKSIDGVKWEIVKNLIDYSHLSEKEVGVQYPSVIVEGQNLYMVLRVANNGAHNHHDTNAIIFKKFNIEELIRE